VLSQEVVVQLAAHSAMDAQEALAAHAINWVQQHEARQVLHESVPMDEHWALIEPQVLPPVEPPVPPVPPVPLPPVPPVAVPVTQTLPEHTRPESHVPLP
jgi:hypothetical protein